MTESLDRKLDDGALEFMQRMQWEVAAAEENLSKARSKEEGLLALLDDSLQQEPERRGPYQVCCAGTRENSRANEQAHSDAREAFNRARREREECAEVLRGKMQFYRRAKLWAEELNKRGLLPEVMKEDPPLTSAASMDAWAQNARTCTKSRGSSGKAGEKNYTIAIGPEIEGMDADKAMLLWRSLGTAQTEQTMTDGTSVSQDDSDMDARHPGIASSQNPNAGGHPVLGSALESSLQSSSFPLPQEAKG